MKRVIKILLFGFVTVVFVFPIAAFAKQGNTYTFGVLGPLTGPVGGAGLEQQAIIEYRLAQINKNSGDQFMAVYADDQCDGSVSPGAYQQLVEDEDVDFILGTICSGAASGVVDNLEADGVLMVSGQNSNAALLAGRSDNYFSLSYSDNDIGRRLAEEICAFAPGGTMAILTENVPFTQGLRSNQIGTGVLDFLANASVCPNPPAVVSDQIFETVEPDVKPFVDNMLNSGADIIFLNPNIGETVDAIFNDMETRTGWPQLLTHGTMNAPAILAEDAARIALVEGMILIDAPQLQSSEFAKYDAKMEKSLAVPPSKTFFAETPRYYQASIVDTVDLLTSLISQTQGDVAAAQEIISTETFDGFISEVTGGGNIFFGGETFVQGIVAAKFLVTGGVAVPQ